jgi:acetyl esterase/lipase/short-subunit dehydrogenase
MPLDARLRLLLWLGKKQGRSFRPDLSVGAMRAGYAELNRRFGLKGIPGVETREVTFEASDGAPVRARLYRPSDAAGRTLPVLLYFHGGGFVIGDIDAYDGLARFFAREGRIAVLSIEYRLGPEHPLPRAFEDGFDAYAWLQKNAVALGLDPARIAVGGDSAGGGIAAAIASYARERDLAPPAYAFLIYPSVDGSGRFPSRTAYTENLPLTPATIAWFKSYAMNGSGDDTARLLTPLDAPHPESHPPAYVLAAQYDPLVDEGRAYFERLAAAGVAAKYDLRPTLSHALVNFAGIVPEAKRALASGIEATVIALRARPARVAAVTGAASGIGRALALELAKSNYTLALADRDAAGLEQTAALARERTTVSTHVVDVSKKDAVDAFAADVLRAHGGVDVLINNAGVSLAGNLEELSIEEIEWLMNINFWGTVYGVKAFLPALKRALDPTIVNVSSVFGIIAPPGQSAYAASKFAVRGFSESLREELRPSVHVLTVHPGGIKTNIARSARIAAAADQESQRRRAASFEKHMLTQSPEKAARAIVRGIVAKKDRVLIGTDALRIEALARVLGPGGARVIANATLRGSSRTKRRAKAAKAEQAAKAPQSADLSPRP